MPKSLKSSKMGNNDFKEFWNKYNLRWVIIIFIWTFFLTMGISILAEVLLSNTEIVYALLILLVIILIGVVSDMIGIAVTAASEKPFHAMAADRVPGAKAAIKLLKNAGPVSNFCNDVIGDICGIVSGVAGASIILQLQSLLSPFMRAFLTIVMSGFIASLTVGGKAIGKSISINQSQQIVFSTAKFVYFVQEKLGIDLIPDYNGKNKKER